MGLAELLKPRICELGKIKIGGKSAQERTTASGTKWRAPEKLDHFIVTTLNRAKNGDLVPDEALMKQLAVKYGDKADGKLRQLPVRLLSNDIDDVMQSAWVWYGGKQLAGKSDGETVTWYADPTTMKFLAPAPPKVEPWKPEFAELVSPRNKAKLFKLHTTFNCVISAEEARFGGVYKFRTTSRISADQLYGSMLHLQQLTGGVLLGLPFMLVVRPIQVAPEGKPTTVYVVHCEVRGPDLQAIQSQAAELAKFQLANARQIQSSQSQYRKLLTVIGEEGDDEVGDVVDEFTPENVELVPPNEHDPLLATVTNTVPAKTEPAPEPVAVAASPIGEEEAQAIREQEMAEADKDLF